MNLLAQARTFKNKSSELKEKRIRETVRCLRDMQERGTDLSYFIKKAAIMGESFLTLEAEELDQFCTNSLPCFVMSPGFSIGPTTEETAEAIERYYTGQGFTCRRENDSVTIHW